MTTEAKQAERRRGEWAQVRADIDVLLWQDDGRTQLINIAGINNRLIRAYHAGFRRAAEMAVPRQVAAVRAECWNEGGNDATA